MSLFEKTFEVDASADKVWPLVAVDRMPEWFDMFRSVEWISNERNQVGSKIHVVNEVAQVRNDFDAEITQYAGNGEGTQAWKTTGGNLTAAGAIYLKPEGNKTLVMMVEEYKLPHGPIGRMLNRIRVHKAFEDSFNSSAQRLKERSKSA